MKKNNLKVIAGAIFFIMAIILGIINMKNDKGLQVTEWNNYYNEDNIVFFYEKNTNSKIKELNQSYNINRLVSGEKSELDKVLKVTSLVNNLVEYDGVADTNLNNGIEILEKKKEEIKTSSKDMAIITRDMLTSLNIYSRVGTFRKKNSQFESSYEYSVLEYWSSENNKWVMIDVRDEGVFYDKDRKLSAIEVLSSDIRKISYLGKTPQKDYKNKLNEYLASYSIPIDNGISDNKSNSYITYLKEKVDVEIKYKNKFAQPSIFTRETKLFERSPFNSQYGRDEKAYIILSATEKQDEKTKESSTSLIIGGFKDDKIMDKYYLNINGKGYEEVEKYKQISLEKGITKIELSLDGATVISSITLNNRG